MPIDPPSTPRLLTRLPAAARRAAWALRGSRAARRAVLVRLAAVAVVIAVAWSTGHELRTAAALRHRWGPTQQVLVTTRPVHLGEMVDERNTRPATRPVAQLPDGALRTLPSPRRATAELVRGEVVTEARVGSRAGVASGVPAGHAAVAVAVQSPAPPVEPGDHVQLLAGSPSATAELSAADVPARTVSRDAVVLAGPGSSEDTSVTLTLAVPQSDAAGVAGAALEGPLAIIVPSDHP